MTLLRGVILDTSDLEQMKLLHLKIVDGELADEDEYHKLLDDRAETLDHLTDGQYCEGHEGGQDFWAVSPDLEATLIKVFPELLIHNMKEDEWTWDYHWEQTSPE